MHTLLEQRILEFDAALKHGKEELAALRTGRATPALVEDLVVEAYGARQPLRALATITTPDPRTVVIEPWDKSVVQDIERGLRASSVGVEPMNDGRVIRLNIPPLTEESRRNLIKVLGTKLEAARITVRRLRDRIREEIISAEKEKTISEDEKFKLQKELDALVADYNERIKKMGEEKEKEIMTV